MNNQAPGPSINARSCVSCRQRKIKCNKQQPCLNCISAQRECIQSAPAPPRRRKGRVKLTEEQLMRRLRKYETLLKGYGVKVEDLYRLDDDGTKSGNSLMVLNSISTPENVVFPNLLKQSLQSNNSGSPVHNLWTNLSDELLEGLPEEEESSHSIIDDSEISSTTDAGTSVFDPRPLDNVSANTRADIYA